MKEEGREGERKNKKNKESEKDEALTEGGPRKEGETRDTQEGK